MDKCTVQALTSAGFSPAQVDEAIRRAEDTGSSSLGWCNIRRRHDTGEMIALPPDCNGIYVGDYASHLVFSKILTYKAGPRHCADAKYRDLGAVLSTLEAHKTNGFILCQCEAGDYALRKKQVEKLGYSVHRSNVQFCSSACSTCYFLVA